MDTTGSTPDRPAQRPGYWRRRRRLLIALLALGTCLSFVTERKLHDTSREPALDRAVLTSLRGRGLEGKGADFRWVDPPRPTKRLDLGGHRFVALLNRPDEETDVWLGRAILSPEARLLRIDSLHNLTDTSAVSEQSLTLSNERLAWTVANENVTLSVHLADLRGRPLEASSDWSLLDRAKARLTFLQETGQLAGIDEKVFDLVTPEPNLLLHWVGASLAVVAGEKAATIAPDGKLQGSLELQQKPQELGHPGDLVTWAVDRVRALPWFGSDRMQWLKTVAFSLLDYGSRMKSTLVDRSGAEEIRSALGDTLSFAQAQTSDPETGWPPKPLSTYLTPAIPGEGHFKPLDDDPFALPPEGGPSPFAFAFLRTDPSRPHSQVFVVAYDPRRLELHTISGTREPKTATGETGPGRVARTPDRVGRLAAAFNGGFQATHGEFGMMADRIQYLPPKPYAATIAELDDGTTGFGTWPESDTIGPEYVGYRQNLTPLLADGVDNPYKRTWWGGVPPGWEDATRTVRTGICLTTAGYAAYFYGSSIDAEHLLLAMKAARCRYGLHLDMNPGHTGFEFYRVAKTANLPELGRKLETNWEARDEVSEMPGWSFLGRRLLRGMQLMHFPRYVRTDSRDFFYLTHRPVLTRQHLTNLEVTAQPKGLEWQLAGLPLQGFPPAIATAKWAKDERRPNLLLEFVLLDAKWAKPCERDCAGSPGFLTQRAPVGGGELTAYYAKRRFFIGKASKDAPAESLRVASGQSKTACRHARAAVGITDGQWLYYVEVTAGADPKQDLGLLDRMLDDFGCGERLFLEQPLALSTNAASDGGGVERLTWVRDDRPMARRILENTPVVGYDTWAPLQAKRIRYKRQRNPASVASASATPAEPANPAPNPAPDETE